MAPQIQVEVKPAATGWECRVTVSEGGSVTVHTVTVEASYQEKLVGAAVPVDRLVQESFEFLLVREPKESILRTFNLSVIARYFPEYEQDIRKRF